jgi:hypothetical protein
MAAVVAWGWVVLMGPRRAEVTAWWIGGQGRPDLATVDGLARSQLFAHRLGGSLVLRDACEELEALLDLVGLRREVGGQTEGGEQVLGVEEGVEPGDPVA